MCLWERENVGGGGNGDGAVEGAEPGGKSFVVFGRVEDEFGEPLDRMWGFGGECGAQGLGYGGQLLEEEVGDGIRAEVGIGSGICS